jgi:hypothetical protein
MKNYRIAVKALLALLALSAAACLLSYAYGSVQGMAQRGRLEKRAASRLQEEEFNRLGAELAEWKKLPADLQQFRREHVISMDDFANFRRDLNLCLDDNGFPAPNISFQFGSRSGHLLKVTLQFILKGSYRSLKKFIYDMEGKPKMQFFDKIDLSASGEEVTGHFLMEAYLGE